MDTDLDAEPTPSTKAANVAIPVDASAGEAFADSIEACLAHLRPNESCWLDIEHPDCLHQTRVSTRRLRALLSLMRELVRDDPVAMDLKARMREILRPLGPARDLDVALVRAREESWPTADIVRLSAARAGAYAGVRATLESPGWALLWSDFDAWRLGPDWLAHVAPLRDGPARIITDAALERRYRRVLRSGKHLLTMPDHALHRVRIEGKKLRYGCQFFDTLYPDAGMVVSDEGELVSVPLHFASRVAEMQDAFGLFNDFAVARELHVTLGLTSDELDSLPTRADCVTAWERVAELDPFWRGA